MKRDAMVPHASPPAGGSPLSKLAHFGFLTLPNFSMIAFTSAIEVLRMANYVGRAEHYTWSVITTDGEPALASNGITVKPTQTLDAAGMPDVLIVCAGWHVREYVVSDLMQRQNQIVSGRIDRIGHGQKDGTLGLHIPSTGNRAFNHRKPDACCQG